MAMFPDEGQLSKTPKRRAADAASRKVRTRAVLSLVIALLAGIGATGLIWQQLKQREADQKKARLVRLVVAKGDLPVATTLGPETVRTVDWPEEARPPKTFTDLKSIEGRVINAALADGDLITEMRLAAKGSGEGLASLLKQNMRIMAVKVNEVSGVNGFLHPNDHVDVITTMTQPGPETNKQGGSPDVLRTKIVLQNLLVKAVGKEIVTQNSKPVDVTVVLMEVTPEQSEKLALAAGHGELQLTMRSPIDGLEVDTPGVTAIELMGPAPSPQMVAAATAPTVVASSRHRGGSRSSKVEVPVQAPPVEGDVVEILRGAKLEERKFRPQPKESPR